MQTYNGLHKAMIVLCILALLVVTYAATLINNFKTPEVTANFFQKSNAYYYIAEIVKTDIRSKYPINLRTNVIKLTVTDSLLNFLVTPNLIERVSLPLLRARQKIAQLPLSFANNNLVINTKQYTDQFTTTLASFDLPPALTDAGNNLIAAVPSQITVVDTKKNPNSVLVTITQTRTLFDHIQAILTISWIVLIIALIALLMINLRLLQRLISGLAWIFVICGVIILLLSFLGPFIANAFASNPNPIDGVLKDQLINSIVSYYFSLTRTVSIVFLVIAAILFCIYYFAPWLTIQSRFLPQPTIANPATKQAKQPSRKRTRK